MNNEKENQKKGKIVKYAIGGIGGAIVLLIALYFFATSGFFIKTFILPRSSAYINGKITADDIELSPFSKVQIRNLVVSTTDGKPVVSVGLVKAEYDLMKILKGNFEIKSVTVESPVINLEIVDGKNNISSLLKETKAEGAKPSEPSTKPLNLNLGEFAISNGKINFKSKQSNEVIEASISDFAIKTAGVKNNGTATISVSGLWSVILTAITNKNEIAGNTKANLTLSLENELMPGDIKGDYELNITKSSGDFSAFSNLTAKVDMDLNMRETRRLSLSFTRGAENLGTIGIAGKYDIKTLDANIKVNIDKISGNVLSLISAKFGTEIASSGLNGALELATSNNAKLINAKGEVSCDKLSVRRAELQTPSIDSRLKFDLSADLLKSNAIVRTLDLNIIQTAKPLISLQLTRELAINWGSAGEGLGESSVSCKITDFDFASWRGVLGTNFQTGKLNLTATSNIKNAGKFVDFDVKGNIQNLNAVFESNKISNTDIALDIVGNLENFEKLNLAKSKLTLSMNSRNALDLSAAGIANIKDITAKLNLQANANIPVLLSFAPQIPDIVVNSGIASFKGEVSKDFKIQQGTTNKIEIVTAKGNFSLDNFAGVLFSNKVSDISASADFDIAQEDKNVAINNAALTLQSKNKNSGAIVAKGTVNLDNFASSLSFQISNLNQEIIKPVANQYLGKRNLQSVDISANLNANYHPQKDSLIAGNVEIKKLLVEDPEKIIPTKPIEIASVMDIGISKSGVADIRKFNVDFKQADKPAGSVELTGKYDISNNVGQIKLNLKDINQEGIAPLIPPIANIGSVKTLSINGNLSANYNSKSKSDIQGGLTITNVVIVNSNGVAVSNPLSFELALAGEMDAKGVISLKKFSGNVFEGKNPAGSCDVVLTYETNSGNAVVNLKIDNLNQDILKIAVNPLVPPGKSLKQISISGNLSADYKPKSESVFKGNLKVAKLQIEDSKKKTSTEPIDIEIVADTAMTKQDLNLKKVQLAITPTERAKNIVETSGKINFVSSNVYSGNVQLTSESIDLSKVYTLINELSSEEEKKSKESDKKSEKPASGAETEPPAVNLPLSNFTFSGNIKKFWLNEIQIDNFQTVAKIDKNIVELNPFKLTFNGAPVDVRTKLNLGVPGYQYDVALKIVGLPLSPIIASLKPELKLTSGGEIFSDISIKGKGATGKSLKENLNGQVSLVVTNANIQLVSGVTKVILSPIAFILGIPEIVSAPIQSADANIVAANGRIDIQKFMVKSPVFMVETVGAIPIDDILTNSPLDLPITMALKQEYAKRFSLQNHGEEYVRLPQFATVKGTLGNPDVKIDKLKVAAMTAVGIGTATSNRAGNLIRNVTNVLTGQSGATNQVEKPATNTPAATPQPLAPVRDLFNIFKRKTN